MAPRNSIRFTQDELADALILSRSAFVAKHGSRWKWDKARAATTPQELPPVDTLSGDTLTHETTWGDYWEALKGQAQQERASDTDITRDTLDLSALHKPIGWLFDGDFHVGSKWTDYATLEDNMRYIGAWRERNPDALILTHMGDPVDGYMPNGGAAGGMYEEVVTRIDKQEGLFLYVAQLAGPWTYMHYGCHSAWTLTRSGRDPISPLINAINDEWRNHRLEHPDDEYAINHIGAKNAGYGLEVDLKLGDQTYSVVSRHRMRRESSLNTENAMRALDDDLGPAHTRADVVALGHMHTPELHVRLKSGRDVVYLRSGAYKGGDCFARAIGVTTHRDAHPGPGLVIFRPDRHETIAFDWRAWREGLALLEKLRG